MAISIDDFNSSGWLQYNTSTGDMTTCKYTGSDPYDLDSYTKYDFRWSWQSGRDWINEKLCTIYHNTLNTPVKIVSFSYLMCPCCTRIGDTSDFKQFMTTGGTATGGARGYGVTFKVTIYSDGASEDTGGLTVKPIYLSNSAAGGVAGAVDTTNAYGTYFGDPTLYSDYSPDVEGVLQSPRFRTMCTADFHDYTDNPVIPVNGYAFIHLTPQKWTKIETNTPRSESDIKTPTPSDVAEYGYLYFNQSSSSFEPVVEPTTNPYIWRYNTTSNQWEKVLYAYIRTNGQWEKLGE